MGWARLPVMGRARSIPPIRSSLERSWGRNGKAYPGTALFRAAGRQRDADAVHPFDARRSSALVYPNSAFFILVLHDRGGSRWLWPFARAATRRAGDRPGGSVLGNGRPHYLWPGHRPRQFSRQPCRDVYGETAAEADSGADSFRLRLSADARKHARLAGEVSRRRNRLALSPDSRSFRAGLAAEAGSSALRAHGERAHQPVDAEQHYRDERGPVDTRSGRAF